MSKLYASWTVVCRKLKILLVQCRAGDRVRRSVPVIGSDLQIRINIARPGPGVWGWVRRGFIIQSIMRLCGTDNVVAGYYVRTPITRDQSQVSVSVVTASSTLMILHKYTVHSLAGSSPKATTTTLQLDSFLFHLLRNVLNSGSGMLINWDLSRNYSDIVWSWSVTIKYNYVVSGERETAE